MKQTRLALARVLIAPNLLFLFRNIIKAFPEVSRNSAVGTVIRLNLSQTGP